MQKSEMQGFFFVKLPHEDREERSDEQSSLQIYPIILLLFAPKPPKGGLSRSTSLTYSL